MPFMVLATLRGSRHIVEYLLEQKVEDVNVADEGSGNTPLHFAIMMLEGEEEGM
jgi:hypothetical protein